MTHRPSKTPAHTQEGWGHTGRFRLLLTTVLLVALTSACNLPYPELKNADRTSVSEATLEVGATTDIYAGADSGSYFPIAYKWETSDPDVLRIENSEELGAYSQRATVTGVSAGTATLTYGEFVNGRAGERSDSIQFTVVPASPVVPTLSLTGPSAAGWETTPEADLSDFSSLRIELLFNVDGFDQYGSAEFFGDSDGRDPASELQIAAAGAGAIGATTLAATFTSFPTGSPVNGETIAWDVTVDLSNWPEGATSLSLRPVDALNGTAVSNFLTLTDATLTITP